MKQNEMHLPDAKLGFAPPHYSSTPFIDRIIQLWNIKGDEDRPTLIHPKFLLQP